MKQILILLPLLLLALIVLLVGCLKKNAHPPMETVGQVDLNRYTGRWYEIARYPHRFEEGCSSVSADYSFAEDGTISVLNQCRLVKEGGKVKKAQGRAKVVDRATNAKLKVSFFWPFYGAYWILKLDKNYQYAIVGEPSRKYVWILSRTPEMDSTMYMKLVKDIERFGYNPAKLIKTDHEQS